MAGARAFFKSEREFIRWLKLRTPRLGAGVRVGIGDDAAVVEIRSGSRLLLKSDLSVEGVHFLQQHHPPRAVGHRALARSASDIAAMGGNPRYAMISMAISRKISRAWLDEFYQGFLGLARRLGVSVVGGDTNIVPDRTSIDVMIAGEIASAKGVLRSGARPGDQIFVSGWLGLSALGLHRLTRRSVRQSRKAISDSALRAHLYPEPRLTLGRYLSENHLTTAVIDVSDGLSTDLRHLCDASGVGARIWAERLPAPTDLTAQERREINPLDLALHGGEDYELLLTVPVHKLTRLKRRVDRLPLHWIGEVRRGRDLLLIHSGGRRALLKPQGYDHFKK